MFVLTDIGNESMVILLLYTNEINLKEIVDTTSYRQNNTVREDLILNVIDAYEKVHENFLAHSSAYPSADYFRSILSGGKALYGMANLENGTNISTGTKRLIQTVDETSEGDHIYVLVWGGSVVAAEAPNYLRLTSPARIDNFISKFTIYEISDQDDPGFWIRANFENFST